MQGQPRIEILLEEVVKKKASDLHLQVGLPPMLRVDGALIPVSGADVLSDESVETLIFAILDEDQKQILLKDKAITVGAPCKTGVVGAFENVRERASVQIKRIDNAGDKLHAAALAQVHIIKFTVF